MELRIEVVGEVVERQELLNGTQTIAIEGASAGGEWTLTGALSWNRGLVDYAGEGDVALSRRDGAEIFGTLTEASVADEGDAGMAFIARYEIDGGSAAFAGAAGDAEASGRLSGDAFRGTWVMRLSDQ